MVEVQFIRRTTNGAFSSVTLPHFQFYACGNNATTLCVHLYGLCKVFLTLYGNQTKLKYDAVIIAFLPRIDQMENPIIRPDSGPNLFVHPYTLWWPISLLEKLCPLMKLAISSQSARGIALGLVNELGVGTRSILGMIVAFVNKSRASILDPVSVWCIRANGHQDN